MKAGHICTCKSFVPWKLECNVNKVRGLFYFFFFFADCDVGTCSQTLRQDSGGCRNEAMLLAPMALRAGTRSHRAASTRGTAAGMLLPQRGTAWGGGVRPKACGHFVPLSLPLLGGEWRLGMGPPLVEVG